MFACSTSKHQLRPGVLIQRKVLTPSAASTVSQPFRGSSESLPVLGMARMS